MIILLRNVDTSQGQLRAGSDVDGVLSEDVIKDLLNRKWAKKVNEPAGGSQQEEEKAKAEAEAKAKAEEEAKAKAEAEEKAKVEEEEKAKAEAEAKAKAEEEAKTKTSGKKGGSKK